MEDTSNGRQPLMEEDLKWKTIFNGRSPQVLKVEYLSNRWLDPSQILILSKMDQTEVFMKWNDQLCKMASKYEKWNISALADQIFVKFLT